MRFFLQAVVSTAESGKWTFRRILALRQELDLEVVKLGRRAENARQLIMHLYQNPKITVNEAMEILGVNYVPANGLISTLVDLGVLQEITGYQRNRIFLLRQYIDIFRTENET